MANSGIALAPFLLDVARDLETTLAATANLVAVMSVTWGVASLTAGAASDRLGRRPILVAAVVTMAAARIGLAWSETYASAVAWQLVTGLGGGAFMGTVFATVSELMPPAQRGRALGWVITGQSLSLVFGVPLITFIGGLGGWRVAILSQGLAALAAALGVGLAVPPALRATPGTARPATSLVKVFTPPILAYLAAGTMERACFAAMTVYFPTFLLATYRVSFAELAVALGLVALGNLAGNVLGSQVADRLPGRPLWFAGSAVVTAVLALPLMLWQPGVAISVALGFAYSLTNSVGRPPLMAALSEVPSEVRGAILGLNITSGSLGWIGATALGGGLVTRYGFGSLGLFSATMAFVGATLAAAGWWWAGGRHSPLSPARTEGR